MIDLHTSRKEYGWSFQRSVSSPERGSKNLQGSDIVRFPNGEGGLSENSSRLILF